ncbi:hypothetical protein GOV14_01250 [Candidatus Pacearchaeota archaeon]|nr:hypothetical protein [Candidatus Pacearchaeota archaeon]
MTTEDKFLKAVQELRKTEKKVNFNQTVDLIINLKNFDVRRESFNIFVPVPHKVKERKIAGFFERKSKVIDTIIKNDFSKYKEKKEMKRLIRKYDAFIASAKLMPSIATSFGRVLGPVGKMPSPQLGILPSDDEKMIQAMMTKINSTVRVRVKEPSIKIAIAKEALEDKDIAENALAVYQKILEKLPKKIDNVRSIKIKFSMDKPVSVKL